MSCEVYNGAEGIAVDHDAFQVDELEDGGIECNWPDVVLLSHGVDLSRLKDSSRGKKQFFRSLLNIRVRQNVLLFDLT